MNVHVSTMVFGKGDSEYPIPEVHLQLVSERLMAQTIISQAVVQQLDAFLRQNIDEASILQQLDSQYLKAEDVERQQSSGKIALEAVDAPSLSVVREVERVLQAFKNKRFKMFVDGQEVQRLDDILTLGQETQVKFLRLISLVGG